MSDGRQSEVRSASEGGSLAEDFMEAVRESIEQDVYQPPVLHPAQYARALQILGLPADHRLTCGEYLESQKTFSVETLHRSKDA